MHKRYIHAIDINTTVLHSSELCSLTTIHEVFLRSSSQCFRLEFHSRHSRVTAWEHSVPKKKKKTKKKKEEEAKMH